MVLELPNRLRILRLRDTEGPRSPSSNMNNGNLRLRESKTSGSFPKMMSNMRRDELEQSPRIRRTSSRIMRDKLKEYFKL